MPPEAKKKHITSADYISLIEQGVLGKRDRVELIHGKIIEMSPIGKYHHFVVGEMNERFTTELAGKAKVFVQGPIKLGELSMPEPDLVVCRRKSYRDAYPGPEDILLLIEVADSSLEYDREVKIPLYAVAGIPECWLVNLRTDTLEVYRSPEGNRYKEQHKVMPGGGVTIKSLGLELSLDEFLGAATP